MHLSHQDNLAPQESASDSSKYETFLCKPQSSSQCDSSCAGGWRHQIAIALQGKTIFSSPALQKSNEMTNIGYTNVKSRSQNHFRSEDIPTEYVYVEGYGVVPVAPARVEQAIPRARSCVPSLNAVNGPCRDSSAAPRSHSLAPRSQYNDRAVEELHIDANLPPKETASGVCAAVKNGTMGKEHGEQCDELAHREPLEHPDIENIPDKVSTDEATEPQLAQQHMRSHDTGADVHNEATVCANLHQSGRQPIEQDGGCQYDTLNMHASPAKDQEQDNNDNNNNNRDDLPPTASNTSPKVPAPESTGAKSSCQGLHGPSLPKRSNVRQRARKQFMAQAINSLTKRPDSTAQAPMPQTEPAPMSQTEPCGVLERSPESYVRIPDSNCQRVEDEEHGNDVAEAEDLGKAVNTSKSSLLGEQPNGNASILPTSEIPEELQEQSFPSLEPSSSVSASQLTDVQRHKRKRSSTPSSTTSPYSEGIQPIGEQQALEESQGASHESGKPPPKRRKRQKIQNKPPAVDRVDSNNVPEPDSKAKNPPRKKPVKIVVPKVKAAQPARDIASNNQGAVPDIQVPTLGSMKSFAVFHETWDKGKEGERPAMKEYLDLKIRKPGFEYRRYSEWKKLANEINRIAVEREIPGAEVAELLDCKRGNRSLYMFTDSFIHKSGAISDWL